MDLHGKLVSLFYNPLLRNPSTDYLSHGGNESTENFRRVVRPFIHETRGHSSQVLQPSVDQSTGSVATEVATSVSSSRNYMMSPSAIKTEYQDPAPTECEKKSSRFLKPPTKAISTLILRISNKMPLTTGGPRDASEESPQALQ